MRVDELALSQAFLPSVARAGIHETGQLAGHNLGTISPLLTFNHVIDALLVVAIGLSAMLAVIRVRKRRLEKLLERLEEQDGE